MIGSIFGSGVGGLDDAVGWVCPGSLPFIYMESKCHGDASGWCRKVQLQERIGWV